MRAVRRGSGRIRLSGAAPSFCERLIACLTWLQDTQNDPIPPHLESQFITDAYPLISPSFEPDTGQLCNYSLALAQILTNRELPHDVEQVISDLLFGLVCYLAAELKAPRWVHTANGIVPVNGGAL
ncbi:hypothetical protein SOASR030_18850 [Leminorella grimontii]|uniref:Uncharacterized protein n=1 Tax=Leminorella grimontii TaxID=82981 RepID=A0AAV5N2N3_9GAMM|nr:hypothetical protein [Leminorella grimontii]KFC93532.1 hypothetical protein GLGR_3095 [Leminorella grimontii ATCC 33999 = DSM 5078]GKX55773.1 hypothetical protein SOASR030_18850 [Leminorella grimontii]VFS55207.1 Uncharacterised protein [Leminorella grimontii]